MMDARFNKTTRQITFECWPRFPGADGRHAQFPGWPITVAMDANDGRAIAGYLPELNFKGATNPVVQVIEDATGEILYTIRVQGERFRPRVYRAGTYTVKAGRNLPDGVELKAVPARASEERTVREVAIP